MDTYQITLEMLTKKPGRNLAVLYPGVTGPGLYTWDELRHTYLPVGNQQNVGAIHIDDIESGLGIGGVGSDDFNIHTEGDSMLPQYDRAARRPGQQVCPAGTTYGVRGNDDDVCVECGQPGDWNPGAGCVLCDSHWDEY